jgi:hypothetical protein
MVEHMLLRIFSLMSGWKRPTFVENMPILVVISISIKFLAPILRPR